MTPTGNRDQMGVNRGAPPFPNANAGLLPPPPPSPFQVAFDVTQNAEQLQLFTQRKQREFIPEYKKDEIYWNYRRRNNEAAKRCRWKRRFNDMTLEQRVVELSKENHIMKAQLAAIKNKFGINGDNLIVLEQILGTLPSNEQLLNLSKRQKMYSSAGNMKAYDNDYYSSPSPNHESETGSSRSPPQYKMERSIAPYPSLPPITIEIGKPHQAENHPIPMNNNCQDDSQDNIISNSPSENALNLSWNGNQSSPKRIMELDEETNCDSNESSSVSQGIIEDKSNFGAKEQNGKESERPQFSTGRFYANENNNAYDTTSNLPPKLRHKSNLGEKELSPYTNSARGLQQNFLEKDPCLSMNTHGSEEYLRENLQPIEPNDADNVTQHKAEKKEVMPEFGLETENYQLKSDLARLAAEVTILKTILYEKKILT
ncbi:unnamed protein product [Orchesella dallaii]|uniref:BZIP domain-containing protein n=1 Tax=Orchesella dallaii TaxID=48710 RepID=A0ABP1Q7U9_9HEXA